MFTKEVLTKDFERRIFRLENAIQNYRETGSIGNLFPCLFSVFSKCFCFDPTKNVKV